MLEVNGILLLSRIILGLLPLQVHFLQFLQRLSLVTIVLLSICLPILLVFLPTKLVSIRNMGTLYMSME